MESIQFESSMCHAFTLLNTLKFEISFIILIIIHCWKEIWYFPSVVAVQTPQRSVKSEPDPEQSPEVKEASEIAFGEQE